MLDCGTISADDAVCLADCGHVETAQHLFLSCGFYGHLWQEVQSWLGVLGPDPRSFQTIYISLLIL
jgi:hypothetical protein